MILTNKIALSEAAIVLREGDDVAVAKRKIAMGTTLSFAGGAVMLLGDVPAGHKFALHAISDGWPVHKFGQIIGYATMDIRPGEWVHTRNLGFGKGHVEGSGALEILPAP